MDAAVNAMMEVIAIIFWFMVLVLVAEAALDALKWGKQKIIRFKDARNARKYAKWKKDKW